MHSVVSYELENFHVFVLDERVPAACLTHPTITSLERVIYAEARHLYLHLDKPQRRVPFLLLSIRYHFKIILFSPKYIYFEK